MITLQKRHNFSRSILSRAGHGGEDSHDFRKLDGKEKKTNETAEGTAIFLSRVYIYV